MHFFKQLLTYSSHFKPLVSVVYIIHVHIEVVFIFKYLIDEYEDYPVGRD